MTHHHLLSKQIETYLTPEMSEALPKGFVDAINNSYRLADQESDALKASASLLHTCLNSIHEAILAIDLQGNIQLFNPNFRSLFRLDDSRQEIESLAQLADYFSNKLGETNHPINTIQNALKHPERISDHEFTLNSNRTIEAFSSPQWLGESIVGQVWSFRDITDVKLQEEEAKHRAYHDFLTGLPNRRLLTQRLNQVLQSASGEQDKTVVLFIDLDGFKDVNDFLGHNIGDMMLKEVAERLLNFLPKNSLLARHGGDEFVAILDQQQNTIRAIEISQKILQSFHEPFNIGPEPLSMSASIGIASAPEHGDDADKLISHADIAMFNAKQQGKNTFQLYHIEKEEPTSHRLKIRNELNTAIENDAFELFFQPKISLDTGSIKGAEALIRWPNGDGSYRSPMEFIPIAEENGQIIPISQWVIRQCCKHLQAWQSDLDEDFVLALNISAKHFQKGQLQEDIATTLKAFDIEPRRLEIEVTETAIMDDIDLAVETLEQLKELGIRIAIDDFGTGQSSLNYLRKLPIEILKIDKSFIDEILTSKEDRTLVKGIIDMVHALGIEVVAEGVENHHMAELLHDMDCDLVQGYHYCKPVPEQEFLGLMQESLCYI